MSGESFLRLLERRDLAAYRAVSVIQQVLDFFEAEDFESAENLLAKALAEFREADRKVTEYRQSLKKENASHGHRAATKHPAA